MGRRSFKVGGRRKLRLWAVVNMQQEIRAQAGKDCVAQME